MTNSCKLGIFVFSIFISLLLIIKFLPIAVTYAGDLDSFNVKEILTVHGQEHTYFTDENRQITSPIGYFILLVITYLLQFIGALSILMICVGGVLLMTARGNESQLEKGKDLITYAIIGLIVAFSSYIISVFVQSLTYSL